MRRSLSTARNSSSTNVLGAIVLSAHRGFFVQASSTPNDDCMKFFAEGQRFLEPGYGTVTFDRFNHHLSPLAFTLINGHHDIVEVTIGETFITVRRREEDDTEELIEELKRHGHYVAGPESANPGGSSVADDGGQHERNREQFVNWVEKDLRNSAAAKKDDAASAAEKSEHPRVGEAPVLIPPPLPWDELQYSVSALLTDHLFSGMPHLTPDAPHPHPDTLISESDSDVVASIKELIASTIRPQLQDDGGDIRFVEFRDENGDMLVEMLGACKKCKSSGTTLRDLIERTTRHWIPEVKRVVEWRAPAGGRSH